MTQPDFKQLLDAGVHFGHLKRKWNPKMAPYIFMEQNGIHIIDLYKTLAKLEEASQAMKQIAKSGRQVLFVATKKQAKEIVEEKVKPTGMPYITERWSGGMLTNFRTVRKAVKKMKSIDSMEEDGTAEKLSKRERLQVARERAKLEKNIGSIVEMKRVPSAIFVVDVTKEKIAVAEAKKLAIPVFAMVDTNSDPTVDFPIPANDDAAKSISIVIDVMTQAIIEGLSERSVEVKDQGEQSGEAQEKTKTRARKPRM